jgi:hypothetical protein
MYFIRKLYVFLLSVNNLCISHGLFFATLKRRPPKTHAPLKKLPSPAFRAKRETGRKPCTDYLQKVFL